MSAISMTGAIPCRRRSARRRDAVERLLALGVTDWLIHGRWPRLTQLQKELARHPGEDFDLLRAAKRLPADCGRLVGDRLVITVKGLHRAGTAEHLLADFMEVVQLAHARYLRSQAPTVSVCAIPLTPSRSRTSPTTTITVRTRPPRPGPARGRVHGRTSIKPPRAPGTS